MFKNITYEKKNRWLIIVFLLMGFLVYSSFIKKTINSYNECKELAKRMEIASNAPMQTVKIKNELQRFNNIIGSNQKSDVIVRDALLSLLTSYCQNEDVVLREFPKTIVKQENDLLVETNIFTVESSFVKLICLVYELEQKQKLGKISSVAYFTKKDATTKKMVLTATIYLQNIKKI